MTVHASRLVEHVHPVSGFLPINLATGANAGDWVSLKNYEGCLVVFFKGAGTAGDDPTITCEQATAVAGTGNKALTFTRIHKMQDTVLTAESVYTLVTQTAATSYTDATSAEDAAIWLIDFRAEDFDVDGGFDCLQASIDDVGTNSQIGCVLYILYNAKQPQETTLEAIAD